VLDVFNQLQSEPRVNLKDWAMENPKHFYDIATKLIPTEVEANINTKVTQVITGMEVK
jgi:hypothetical protein